MTHYDLIIIGAGPSGLMAALQSKRNYPHKNILLLEASHKAGQKLLATGGGRCNLFNSEEIVLLSDRYYEASKFMKSVFYRYDSKHLRNFFESEGLKLKEEAKGRIFPESNTAKSVLEFFLERLSEEQVSLCLEHKVKEIKVLERGFLVSLEHFSTPLGTQALSCDKLILACGSSTYPQLCGSDTLPLLAQQLNLNYQAFTPALSSISLEEENLKALSGISLKEIELKLKVGPKVEAVYRGDLLITHKGFSGPVAQNMSHDLYGDDLWAGKAILSLWSNFFSEEEQQSELLKQRRMALETYSFSEKQRKEKISSWLPQHCPEKLKKYILSQLFEKEKQEISQLSKKEAIAFARYMKEGLSFKPLQQGNLQGRPSFTQAKVARGGLDLKEVHPATLECKKIKGFYVIGEALNINGQSGGYNLQACFSTGSLAGLSVFAEDV